MMRAVDLNELAQAIAPLAWLMKLPFALAP
jgi:hypothetical protein